MQVLQDRTPAGRLFSAPLLALLLGLAAAWAGVMPTTSAAYDLIWSHAVPLATALYLLEADLSKCIVCSCSQGLLPAIHA